MPPHSDPDANQALISLVARCLESPDSPPGEAAWRLNDIDPGLIARHRVSLLVLKNREKLGLEESLASAIEQDVVSHLMAAAPLVEETARVSSGLLHHGVSHLVYKGAALGAIVGSQTARGAGDIDLLMPPEQFGEADRALTELGFRRTHRLPPLTHKVSWAIVHHLEREVGYSGDRVAIDLHWRISPQSKLFPPFESLAARSQTVTVGGAAIPTLGTVDSLAALSFHAYFDRFALLRHLVDITQLLHLTPGAEKPVLPRRLGRLVSGVCELITHVFPGAADDEAKAMMAILPPPSPAVWQVWKEFGANPESLRPRPTTKILTSKLRADMAFDNPVRAMPRFIGKRLIEFPPATADGRDLALRHTVSSTVKRLSRRGPR